MHALFLQSHTTACNSDRSVLAQPAALYSILSWICDSHLHVPAQEVDSKVKAAFTRKFNTAGIRPRCNLAVDEFKRGRRGAKKAPAAGADDEESGLGAHNLPSQYLACMKTMLVFMHGRAPSSPAAGEASWLGLGTEKDSLLMGSHRGTKLQPIASTVLSPMRGIVAVKAAPRLRGLADSGWARGREHPPCVMQVWQNWR